MKVGELLPGTVVQVVDNEKGIVKRTAPSMFSVDDDPEVLPPIIPFAPSGHLGSVSTPEEGDLVWIVVDNSNSQMIYYIFLPGLLQPSLRMLHVYLHSQLHYFPYLCISNPH